MRDIPLHAFLASLGDEMRPAIRDYQRILFALRTGGSWSITRLRDTLLALLAHNEDQQDRFLRRFAVFFKLPPDAQEAYAEIDIERVREELDELKEKDVSRLGPRPRPAPSPRPVPPPEPNRRRIAIWATVAGLVLVLVLAALWHFKASQQPQSGPGTLTLTPAALLFGNRELESLSTEKILLQGTGAGPVSIEDVTFAGAHGDDYGLAKDHRGEIVAAGSSRTLEVSFVPSGQGTRTAQLVIVTDAQGSPHVVPLSGVGIAVAPLSPGGLTSRTRLYTDVPYVKGVSSSGAPGLWKDWRIHAGIAAFFLLAAMGYGLYLRHARKIPEDKPARWLEGGPRLFSLGSMGGSPAPRLDDLTLDELADSMGYFKSDQAGKVLDVLASIESTGRNGGVPSLSFYSRKQVRSLLVLEDSLAEGRARNTIAAELAAGMERRGVPAIHGRFTTTPNAFTTEDGAAYELEDLADRRRGLLVLIFTDGKGLHRESGAFALEALTHWPMVAWIDLRETRQWDETATLPLRYGFPIYPATADGLLQAVSRFLSERGAADDFSSVAAGWSEMPPQPDSSSEGFAGYVEWLLGDALLWAQDCAAMVPPVSLGLADGLRRRFHPRLPPDRIERLFALPGLVTNVSGMRFSTAVMRVLRGGFLTRRSADERKAVLDFLLEEIMKAEPEGELAEEGPRGERSMAYLAWESVKERMLLEADPDSRLQRFAELAKSPLGGHIRASLDNYELRGEQDKVDQGGRIPLLSRPRNKEALQRLVRIDEGLSIDRQEAFPVSPRQKVVLALLVVAFIFFGGLSLSVRIEATQQFAGTAMAFADTPARLEVAEGDAWRLAEEGRVQDVIGKVVPDQDYRLTLYGGGAASHYEFTIERSEAFELDIARKEEERSCREELLDGALIVQRCPGGSDSESDLVRSPIWRQRLGAQAPGGRRASIGFEFSASPAADPAVERWHDALLRTGSIDALYRLQRDVGLDVAWSRIAEAEGMSVQPSQMIAWFVGPLPDSLLVGGPRFSLAAAALASSDLNRLFYVVEEVEDRSSRIAELEGLLTPGSDGVVTEAELTDRLASLGLTDFAAIGDRAPIALIRPLATPPTMGTIVVVTNRPAKITITEADGSVTEDVSPDRFPLQVMPGPTRVTAEAAGSVSAEKMVTILEGSEERVFLELTEPRPTLDRAEYAILITTDDKGVGEEILNELQDAGYTNPGNRVADYSGINQYMRLGAPPDSQMTEEVRAVVAAVTGVRLRIAGSLTDQSIEIHLPLAPRGTLEVTTLPVPAGRIEVRYVSTEPFRGVLTGSGERYTTDLPIGLVQVTASTPGYETATDTVRITADATSQITLDLALPTGPMTVTLVRSLNHSAWVHCVAFTPDGKILVSASQDGTVRLWNAQSGQQLVEPLFRHEDAVYWLSISPDGSILASGSVGGELRLWDLQTRAPLGQLQPSHTAFVWNVAFSPDGSILASSSGGDASLRLWDVTNRQAIGDLLPDEENPSYGLAFSPDGSILASGRYNTSIRLFDVQTREPLGDPLTGHDSWVLGIDFSPDGSILAAAGYKDNTILLWDVEKREPIGELFLEAKVRSLAFSPDGSTLASGSDDGTIRLWDVVTQVPLREPVDDGHTGTVTSLAFSPDGRLLASGSRDSTVRLWRIRYATATDQ